MGKQMKAAGISAVVFMFFCAFTGCESLSASPSPAEITSASPVITPTANENASNGNLIVNGAFQEPLSDWLMIGNTKNPYHPDDPGRADFVFKDGTADIKISNEGTGEYSIMFYQSVPFKEKATYRASFKAKADAGVSIISNITQDGTWLNYSGDRSFTLTDQFQEYSYDFTMPGNGKALFQFCLGKIGNREIYIKDIEIYEIEAK